MLCTRLELYFIRSSGPKYKWSTNPIQSLHALMYLKQFDNIMPTTASFQCCNRPFLGEYDIKSLIAMSFTSCCVLY